MSIVGRLYRGGAAVRLSGNLEASSDWVGRACAGEPGFFDIPWVEPGY